MLHLLSIIDVNYSKHICKCQAQGCGYRVQYEEMLIFGLEKCPFHRLNMLFIEGEWFLFQIFFTKFKLLIN